MISKLSIFLFQACLLLSVCLIAKAERVMTVVFPTAVPPWVVAEEKSGYLVEAFDAVAKDMGVKVKPLFWPLQRARGALKDPGVDALAWGDAGFANAPNRTEKLAVMLPVVVVAKSQSSKFTNMGSIKTAQVVGFQGTSSIWSQFGELAKTNRNYRELPDQNAQVVMLLTNRAQALVIEAQIFHWWANKNKAKDQNKGYQLTNLGNFMGEKQIADDLAVVFKNDNDVKLFNKSLAKMRKNGTINRLLKKYNFKNVGAIVH